MSSISEVKCAVLIFEDDLDLASQWKDEFDRREILAEHANSISLAKAFCNRQRFDLVITDIFLKDMSGRILPEGGITLLQYMRQPELRQFPAWCADIPKIGITGAPVFNEHDVLKLAEDFGCSFTARKPFTPDYLVDLAIEIIERGEKG